MSAELGRRDYDISGREALIRLQSHERTCEERQAQTHRRLDRVEGFIVANLVALVGGFGFIIYQLMVVQ